MSSSTRLVLFWALVLAFFITLGDVPVDAVPIPTPYTRSKPHTTKPQQHHHSQPASSQQQHQGHHTSSTKQPSKAGQKKIPTGGGGHDTKQTQTTTGTKQPSKAGQKKIPTGGGGHDTKQSQTTTGTKQPSKPGQKKGGGGPETKQSPSTTGTKQPSKAGERKSSTGGGGPETKPSGSQGHKPIEKGATSNHDGHHHESDCGCSKESGHNHDGHHEGQSSNPYHNQKPSQEQLNLMKGKPGETREEQAAREAKQHALARHEQQQREAAGHAAAKKEQEQREAAGHAAAKKEQEHREAAGHGQGKSDGKQDGHGKSHDGKNVGDGKSPANEKHPHESNSGGKTSQNPHGGHDSLNKGNDLVKSGKGGIETGRHDAPAFKSALNEGVQEGMKKYGDQLQKQGLKSDSSIKDKAMAAAALETSMGKNMPTQKDQTVGSGIPYTKWGTGAQEIGPLRMNKDHLEHLGYGPKEQALLNSNTPAGNKLAGEAWVKGHAVDGEKGFMDWHRNGKGGVDRAGAGRATDEDRRQLAHYNQALNDYHTTSKNHGADSINSDKVVYAHREHNAPWI